MMFLKVQVGGWMCGVLLIVGVYQSQLGPLLPFVTEINLLFFPRFDIF